VPQPRFTANSTVNVRNGPGTNYNAIGALAAGQGFDITGKNAAGSWLQFDYNGRPGWVSADLVTVSGDAGSVQVAQNIPPPPTARPTARPQPTTPPQPTAPAAPQYPFVLVEGVERCEEYSGDTYFHGYVRYRNNSLRNGACVHIAYYGPRQTKCSGCGCVGDGVWGFSPFGSEKPIQARVEIWVVACPSNFPTGGQDLQTGFGDLTPLSKKWGYDVKTGQSVKCEGITFAGD
jgi:hypothetical protein